VSGIPRVGARRFWEANRGQYRTGVSSGGLAFLNPDCPWIANRQISCRHVGGGGSIRARAKATGRRWSRLRAEPGVGLRRWPRPVQINVATNAMTNEGNEMTAQETPSLYHRLGGVYNIATVVDDLIDRVMVDARLNANPRVDEAHHRVSPAGFKYYVTEMLCQAAGGPQQYSGRSMEDSHRHLEITEEEWGAFMDDLQQTLNGFDVPPTEQEEVKAIIESTHDDIVVSPLQSATP
jgi:hemoglobin